MADPDRVTLRHRVEFFAIQLLSVGMAMGGKFFAVGTAELFGHLFWLTNPYRRLIVRRNVEIAFGDSKSEREIGRIVRRSFVNLFVTAFEIILRERRPDLLDTPFTEDPPLTRAYDEPAPNGLLILSAHIGNWENAHWWCSQRGKPALSVGRILDNPLLDRWVRKLRGHDDNSETVLPVGGLRVIARVLRSGQTVTLVVDQNKRKDSDWFEFFGVTASTHADWARLVVRLQPRIVCACGIRTRFGSCQLPAREIEIPIEGTNEERARAVVEQYLDWVEDVVRRYPEQYLWMHRRFRTRPEGEPSLYPLSRARERKKEKKRRARAAARTATPPPAL